MSNVCHLKIIACACYFTLIKKAKFAKKSKDFISKIFGVPNLCNTCFVCAAFCMKIRISDISEPFVLHLWSMFFCVVVKCSSTNLLEIAWETELSSLGWSEGPTAADPTGVLNTNVAVSCRIDLIGLLTQQTCCWLQLFRPLFPLLRPLL